MVVTKALPGTRWLEVLTAAGCRVEVCSYRHLNTELNTYQGVHVTRHHLVGAHHQTADRLSLRRRDRAAD